MGNDIFKMTEPRAQGITTRYAFWLNTERSHLFYFVQSLICVAQVDIVDEAGHHALVDIKDEYDADEAWHYIRTELEEEARTVNLDKFWEDALWL
jgi:hypothetical protein